MKRRILHVIIGLGRGGAERALVRLVSSPEANAGYEHQVVSLRDLGCYGAGLRERGIAVHTLGLRGPLSLPRVFFSLVSLVGRLAPDLVQTWMYHADLLGGLAARLAGRPPVLWGVRSFDLKRGAKWATRRVQQICAMTSAWLPTLILCVAESARRGHVELGYDAARMLVIPNGFDVSAAPIADDAVAKLRASAGLSAEHLVVGCVGRFHPAKDHQNLVRAAERLRDRFPHVRYLLIGPGLDHENRILREWIGAAGVADQFVLLGEREDIPQCMAAMDLFCSPSRTEAFPQVVGEAMMMARPCVVTDVGDTAHVVGDTGVVVERENAAALADGLAGLIDAPAAHRAALGTRARERICREYSLERTIELTHAAYARALGAGH